MFIHNPLPLLDLKTIESSKGRTYVTPAGNKYPSITTLLGAVEKPYLANWRAMLGEKKADAETKRASGRGSAVHLMIERHLQNDENPTRNQEPVHTQEYKSTRLYLKKINNILMQEGALYSDLLRIAGRVDCIAEYDGVLSIIDFKTSANDKKSSMIEDYYLQTTAYALMLQELYDIQVDQIVIIMSVERGVVPLVFKQQIEPYIEPLLQRINSYHSKLEAAK